MSSAFSAALAALHADPNLSAAALWSRGGETVPVRVVLSAPDATQSFGTVPLVEADAMLAVPMASLAAVQAGDRFAIGAEHYEVTAAQRDAERLTWTLPCRRVRAATAGSAALQAEL